MKQRLNYLWRGRQKQDWYKRLFIKQHGALGALLDFLHNQEFGFRARKRNFKERIIHKVFEHRRSFFDDAMEQKATVMQERLWINLN